ncbi:MAG: hypothetical protein NTY66_00775, partial [Candidatus Vogelbacteria bacterium]|nr:hypothetical protein [Candidatus Vogelbacteria bacterium]
MHLNPFAKKRSKIVAILDIGSGSVGGALLSLGPDGAEIIYYAQSETRSGAEPDFQRFNSSISQALKNTIGRLQASGLAAPEEYHCFLSSAFADSQTKFSTYRDTQPRVLTSKSINGIARRNAEAFVRSSSSADFYLLENKILRFKLDGYETAEPIGQTASEIELAQYLSRSSSAQIRRLAREISGLTHTNKIFFHSYALAAANALRDYFNVDSFLAVDVSGELTDVAAVIDGVLIENISFPYGANKIIRAIALELNSWPDEVASELRLLSSGKAGSAVKKKLLPALARARTKWLEAFSTVAGMILEHSMLPPTLLLTGDALLNSFIVDWIKSGDFGHLILNRGQFKPIFLNHTAIASTLGYHGNIRDTYVLLEAYHLEKLGSLKSVDRA